MADQQAKFVLTLEGKDDSLLSLFSAFKRSIRSDVSEIERITKNVKLFGDLDAEVKKSAQALDQARAAFKKLRDDALDVGPPTKEVARSLNDAAKAAASAEKTFKSQSEKLDKLRTSLTTAGVDLSNLAAAEQKLAAQAKAAAAAAQEQANKQTLAFKSLKDGQAEISKIGSAYTALATSGRLSFGELSTLHARAQQQVAAVKDSVGSVGVAFREVRVALLGFTAAFAGVVALGAKSASDFRAFTEQIAAIDTIADVSKDRLGELEAGVRTLSRTMGTDAVNSAQALYDILGSGIATDNALEVLARSSEAARAGLTDVKTAASAGVAVLNAYGLEANQLEHVLDVMFQTVRDGVVTFPELAQNIGNVLPIARAANVRIEELGAAFSTLTKIGINAPEASTAIARAIQELAAPAPEAAARMRELGIEFNGLVGTVEQFAQKNLSLDQLQRLIPEARAAKAVLGLAQNFKFLSEQVDQASNSSGQMKAAYAKMADTPQARMDRFNSAVKDLSLSIGQFVTASTPFIEALTGILNGFNNLPEKTKQTVVQVLAFVAAITAAGVAVKVLGPGLNLLAGAIAAVGTAANVSATGLTAASVAARGLQFAVAGLIGFKLGEILYEWFAPARLVGDVLGTLAGAVDNAARLLGGALAAALTLNRQKLDETYQAFLRNAEILRGQLIDAFRGVGETAREAAVALGIVEKSANDVARAAAQSAGAVGNSVSTLLSKLNAEAAAIETALTASQSKLQSLQDSLRQGVDDIGKSAASAIAELAAQVQQRLAALASTDVKLVRETVDIQKQAATERLAILKKFGDDSLLALDAAESARRAIATKSGEQLKRVEQEIAQARIGTLKPIVDAFRAHLDTLLGMQRQHNDRIRELEAERRGIQQDVEEKIREIRRGTLTAYQAYSDRVREIDEFTSKARRALAEGDTKAAEEFAKKAISAASGIAGAVKDGSEEVVSASSAQTNAIRQITDAQRVLLDINKQRTEAEKAGAQAAADGIAKVTPLLKQYEAQLAEVQKKAAEGIRQRVVLETEQVDIEYTKLLDQLAKRDLTLKLKADLTEAMDAVTKAKNEIEKGRIDVNLGAKTDALDAAIKAIQDKKPELQVETTNAIAAVADLRAKAQALEEVKPKIEATVESNVDEVQQKIDDLKKPTRSTHTVDVVVNNPSGAPLPSGGGEPAPGFNRGGPVGDVQRFADGGGVFAGKVPGTGNADTVRANLQAGQYVIRKAAARYYGDGLLGMLARSVRRFAGGGEVTRQEVEKWANSGGTTPPPVNFDSRDVPEAFVTAANVIAYAREMLNAVGANHPIIGSLRPAIVEGIAAVERNPSDKTAIAKLLQAAETIGSNFQIFAMWGKTQSGGTGADLAPVWFIDWLAKQGYNVAGAAGGKAFAMPSVNEFAKSFFATAFERAGPPTNILTGGGSRGVVRRFAEGGSTDTVPALLTPGEHVMRRESVRAYGSRFMDAVNRMAIPRAALARLMSGAPAAPRIARFATGGMVGPAPAMAAATAGGRSDMQGLTAVFNLDGSDLLSEANVLKKVVPVLDRLARRRGKG